MTLPTAQSPVLNSSRFWYMYIAAALCLVPTIWFYYVGEEAVFPIAAMEMMQHGDWLTKTRYGINLTQNPMYVWLIIPFASLLGWEHVLEAMRIITLSSTVGIGLMLAWLAHKLTGDRAFSAFAALIFATLADLLIYRGWLAYVDPTYSLAIFASIVLLWVAALQRRYSLLGIALLVLTCAFLIKTFTAYIFYGTALLVFFGDSRYRPFLLARTSLALHLLAFIFPLPWLKFAVSNPGQSSFMLWEFTDKLVPHDLSAYGLQLLTYPIETILRLSPAALIALYFVRKYHLHKHAENWPSWWKSAFLIAILNMLPYWFAPISASRYLMPLYPFFALAIAWPIWLAGKSSIYTTLRWLTGIIVFQFILALIVFPYYQRHVRGENYYLTAQDILACTDGKPLYTINAVAHGMSITAYIDSMIYPRAPLTIPPPSWDDGFVISLNPEGILDQVNNGKVEHWSFPGKVFKKYQLGVDPVYLLCRGTACEADKSSN